MRGEPRRVQAVGYYGMGNFGDDLFSDVALTVPLWPGATVENFLPARLGPWSRLDAWGRGLRVLATLSALARCDTVAECGGSVLSSLSGTARLRARLARWHRREALGVSVGPFVSEADERAVRAALDQLARLVVRDPASQWRLARPADVGGDLAALSRFLPSERPAPADAVTVCPSQAAGTGPERLCEQVSQALDAVGSPPVLVLALNHHPDIGDETIARVLARRLREDGRRVEVASYGDLGLAGCVRLLAASRAVWSERLHGAIVAFLCQVPFAVVGHHAKCLDFAADIGLDPACLVQPSGTWVDAARRTMDGVPPWSMSPLAYRERAAAVYLGSP